MLREAGAAFAVLAIFVLTILTPLHQSAALQRDMAKLGHETAGAWSICTAINEADDDDDLPTALKCPVAGIGNTKLVLANNSPSVAEIHRLVTQVVFAVETETLPGIRIFHQARARAPPVVV
jgi:invasion protein IalB